MSKIEDLTKHLYELYLTCSLLEAYRMSAAARSGFNDDLPNVALVPQMNCETFVCSHRVYDFNLLYPNVN